MINLSLQIAIKDKSIPSLNHFKQWINAALKNQIDNIEIGIRIIDEQESASLNHTYRNKSGPTNILSFSYSDNKTIPAEMKHLGDLAICASIIEKEASEQKTDLNAHWAHIVIHGCLHLLGYDHQNNRDTMLMEKQEIKILQALGFEDPYN